MDLLEVMGITTLAIAMGVALIFLVGTNTGPIVFAINLGNLYLLDSIAIFNRPTQGNAMKDFQLGFATDSGFTAIKYTTSGLAAANSGTGQQDFALGGNYSAQYVRFSISDNYSGIGGVAGGDRVALNDIQFNTVPEPSLLALLDF